MEAVEILKNIRNICGLARVCKDCKFDSCFCNAAPDHWSDEEIEDMAKIINSYEEEEK